MDSIEEMIDWIDNASYEQLLRKWRNELIDSPWFQGEVGGHYRKVIRKRKAETSDHVKISKEIGWDG